MRNVHDKEAMKKCHFQRFSLFILLGFCILFPKASFSATTDQCFEVASFGSTTANGFYSYQGTSNNSQPVFWNGSTTRPWYLASAGIDSGYWVLRTTLTGINADYASPYYNSDTYTSDAQGHSWANQAPYGGNTPNGIVNLESCESTVVGTTTLSILPTLGSIAFGLGIIIVMMLLNLIWIVYNSITTNKWQ